MTERGIQLSSLDDMARFCRAVANSSLAPKGLQTPEQIMIAVQTGLEVGLSPMQAIQSIAVINGRPTIWGDACLALAMGREDFVDCIETAAPDGTATCLIKRRGRAELSRSFSIEDAKKAGLWGKAGPWQQYPKRMLQMRARSWAIRDAFPDALKGIGIAEEVRDTTSDRPQRAKLELPGELPEQPAPALPEHAEPADQDGYAEGEQ